MAGNGWSRLSNSYLRPDGVLRCIDPKKFLPQPVKRECRAAAARHPHDSLPEAELPASGRAQMVREAPEASELTVATAISTASEHTGQAASTAASPAVAMLSAEQLAQRLVWASAVLTLASLAPEVLAGAAAAAADPATAAAPLWLVRVFETVCNTSCSAISAIARLQSLWFPPGSQGLRPALTEVLVRCRHRCTGHSLS